MNHILVVREDESYEYVSPEEIVARLKREGDTIIVEYDDFATGEVFIFSGLHDFYFKTMETVNIYKRYGDYRQTAILP
ncbi:MAG: hypothetical protein QXR31_06620 [Zestosphaera sp.]